MWRSSAVVVSLEEQLSQEDNSELQVQVSNKLSLDVHKILLSTTLYFILYFVSLLYSIFFSPSFSLFQCVC